MERKPLLRPGPSSFTAFAAFLLGVAAVLDALPGGRSAALSSWTYALVAAAVVLVGVGVLVRVLASRRDPRRNATQLAVSGWLLLAWWLRGDPGVAADPPIVVVELMAALWLAVSALRERRRR